MAEIRRDLVKNYWVAIAANTALKPSYFPVKRRGIETIGNQGFCPFCEGNESSTPAEIMAYREDGSEPNTPGWSVRVVPNKFSVFHLDETLEKKNLGIYSTYTGVGKQEVIIESPEHGIDMHNFSQKKIAEILTVFKRRYNDLAQDERIKYIQIYKNRGIFAGASLEHSHSQMMGLPFVPRTNSGVVDYYKKKGQCLLCAIVAQEKQSAVRIVYESEYFLLICPYASRFSYETWAIPKQHGEHYGDISEAQIIDLAWICMIFTRMLMEGLDNPAYNLIFNTAPLNMPYQAGYHWYLEIIPRLLVTTGADISTGMYSNPVSPELAADLFREKMTKFV
jgi:UDPglucose--hexose-1-phosphate uridylyltransferase